MSERASASAVVAISGAMYATVPSMLPVEDIDTSEAARARPKSVTLAGPSLGTRMFSGLMSRWMTPTRWAARSASSVSVV